MVITFNLIETVLIALFVFYMGNLINKSFKVLRKYNIPESVMGGILFSTLSGILYTQLDIKFFFANELRETMMLAFFTTIGLSADFKLLKKGGLNLFLFLIVATIFLFCQNGIGVFLAKTLGLHPYVGLLAGSITLSGGHGTGATYAAKFFNVDGAMEVAMAAATFGLVLGGVLGGPISQWLIARFHLASDDKVQNADEALKGRGFDQPELVTPKTTLHILFLIVLCIVSAHYLELIISRYYNFMMPSFVYCLFLGILVTNFSSIHPRLDLSKETVDLLGVVSLSIFLSLALMTLKLWELVSLAGPLLVILIVQTIFAVLYNIFVTFRFMGKNYEAAVMVGGHCGFGLGATPTAVANMEAIIMRYGPAHQAFLTVSLVGAFFIDIINTGVIQIFLFFLA